jgi:hypothetical protein
MLPPVVPPFRGMLDIAAALTYTQTCLLPARPCIHLLTSSLGLCAFWVGQQRVLSDRRVAAASTQLQSNHASARCTGRCGTCSATFLHVGTGSTCTRKAVRRARATAPRLPRLCTRRRPYLALVVRHSSISAALHGRVAAEQADEHELVNMSTPGVPRPYVVRNSWPWLAPGMTACPYVPPLFLAPFTRPLMELLARYFPDRSLREARMALMVD